ncbi:NADH-quinone oxidoreductase subunit E [Paracoccus sp. p4-l81]|uniref:NADH-quinone oxidoreductase subunit E n=1 Tax=Paracoccus sp. p4-l81 TaxID=3342806 RepID=UPI0035B7523B
MLRRLHHEQPASFAFTPANEKWARAQMTKYPEGRQASAIIPLLWRAQEQEGWLSRPAIEHVATMLGMPYIRALEVATFYFMFQLAPVGRVAHIQICGTTSCMICGAEDLIAVCREKIAPTPHTVSADGNFSWEEVECLGACTNAPMAQIGKDYYEDLTPDRLRAMIDEFSAGQVPVPGPQNGRWASEPLGGLTSLTSVPGAREAHNGSVALAVGIGDTVKRIDGTEVPLLTPWLNRRTADQQPDAPQPAEEAPEAKPSEGKPVDATGITVQEATEGSAARPVSKSEPEGAVPDIDGGASASRPQGLTAARDGRADDLKLIKGVGPKLEALLHSLGFYHFDQIAGWTGAELAWVDSNLEGFHGRATRDDWVSQAKLLAAGGQTDQSRRLTGKDQDS